MNDHKLGTTAPATASHEPPAGAPLSVGVDVAAAELVVAAHPPLPGRPLRPAYPNTPRGVAAFIAGLRALAGAHEVHVVMEATGSYHVRLHDALAEAGLPAAVLPPLVAKHYARMTGARAKSDPVDAALLARYGAERRPAATPPLPPARRALKQLAAAIRGLVAMRTRVHNQRHALAALPAPDPTCVGALDRVLGALTAEVATLERAQAALVASAYGPTAALLASVPGIGPRTAAALVGAAGDLTGFGSARSLVSYVGLDPSPRSSGTSVRVRGGISKRGSGLLRTLLYLGALSARKHNGPCRALYERLVGRGLSPKAATVAVAGKLLRQAWGVVRSGRPYEEGHGVTPSRSP